ncbi:MAG: pyruvate kinase [bacterium]
MNERRTRIVATIGIIPKRRERGFLRKLIRAGVDIIRINMSHKREEKADETIGLTKLIRETSKEIKKPIAILTDLMGPKIRLGEVSKNMMELKKGAHILIGNSEKSQITVKNCDEFTTEIKRALKDGKNISINIGDGGLVLDAISEKGGSIEFIANKNGRIRTGQGITVRGILLPSDNYNIENHPHDIWSVKTMAEHSDLFSLSFVNSERDIENLQSFIKSEVISKEKIIERFDGLTEYPVVAKIETDTGVLNIDSIMDMAFGIMVARGDMGLQIGLENVPLAQKEIINRCNLWGKPVIVATQMLASMVSSPEPTRAEVSDVANAIIDGADALMLSDETAIGDYPIQAVKALDSIARTVERKIFEEDNDKTSFKRLSKIEELYNNFEIEIERKKRERKNNRISMEETANFISYTSVLGTELLECGAIVAISRSGATARRIARFKPKVPVIIGTMSKSIQRLCSLSYGIKALLIDVKPKSKDPMRCLECEFKEVERIAVESRILKRGMKIARIAGFSDNKVGDTNLLHLVRI